MSLLFVIREKGRDDDKTRLLWSACTTLFVIFIIIIVVRKESFCCFCCVHKAHNTKEAAECACSRMKCPVHMALVIIFRIMLFPSVHFHDHFNYSPPQLDVHSLCPRVHSADDYAVNAIKWTHCSYCYGYYSSCSFERMPELLYRVRFNIPPSIHANQLPWYGWGVILGLLFPSSWLLAVSFFAPMMVAAAVHFAYTLSYNDQRKSSESSVTDRETDRQAATVQKSDEWTCSANQAMLSVCLRLYMFLSLCSFRKKNWGCFEMKWQSLCMNNSRGLRILYSSFMPRTRSTVVVAQS